MRTRRFLSAVAALAAAYAVAGWVSWTAPQRARIDVAPIADDVERFYADRLAASARAGVTPGNDERLVRKADGATPVSILYLHGFGASRAEGEMVIDQIADDLGANTYYLRLPGHGTNPDDHARHGFAEYVAEAEQSFAAARKLGDKVLVVGTSTGALLATYLAAQHPGDVAGAVLASPFYSYASRVGVLLGLPGWERFLALTQGPQRDAGWKTDPDHRKVDGYDDHWMTRQRWAALSNLDDLRRFAYRPEVLARVTAPTLVLYYEGDGAAHVPTMHEGYAQLGGGKAHPKSRMVAIEDGNHILLSKYVRTDKPRILREIRAFLGDIGVPAATARAAP